MTLDFAGEFFQLGYVTRNLDQAIELYRERYGVANFYRFSAGDFVPEGTPGPFLEVVLGYKGPVMIEIIQPAPGDEGIYLDALREDGGVSLHHIGYLVSEDRFAKSNADFRERGFEIPVVSLDPDGVSLSYIDTRSDTGLFTEMVMVNESQQRFFSQIPHN